VARKGEERKVYKVLVGKPEGKTPLRRPRRRWEDGIRMDLSEIGLGGVDWIRLSQDRDRWRAVVSALMNLRVLAPRSYLVIAFLRKRDKTIRREENEERRNMAGLLRHRRHAKQELDQGQPAASPCCHTTSSTRLPS
jgi:hypothetical protein